MVAPEMTFSLQQHLGQSRGHTCNIENDYWTIKEQGQQMGMTRSFFLKERTRSGLITYLQHQLENQCNHTVPC